MKVCKGLKDEFKKALHYEEGLKIVETKPHFEEVSLLILICLLFITFFVVLKFTGVI